MLLGILAGLAAALMQSLSYICTKLFVRKRHQGPLRLLILSHVIMGIAATAVIPFIYHDSFPPLRAYLYPLLGTTAFYFLAQAALFVALRKSDASRIAPLLALKVVFLALISVIFMNQHLAPQQWIAVAACLIAAVMLNYSGGRLPLLSIVMVLLACLGYSLSDINIKLMLNALGHAVSQQRAIHFGVCATYVCCGILALPLWIWQRKNSMKELPYALPFSIIWMAAMFFLFTCFAQLDVLYGNILQSTRGLFSIVLGILLSAIGLNALEQKASLSVWLRRAFAAALMFLAIYLFSTAA